ncbi:MAG: YdcH family protein [Spongiibacter sp.]|uniref:YdcH family protein n=1 Tax=Spongiibacter thalassae TaxID=2721624 RepID=A0ABX1GK26_9GAMM|nr:YdcH family protein [Spongiibacter thalassae]MDX1506207.1 YdcH family protein [Spongiibacter sp.]NKI19604.1 YdcH family protein [Spongiibacter thalassae]
MDNCLSASARLLLLKRRHRALDEEIKLLSVNPWQNQLLLQRLKREKLRIKDNIEWLKNEMVPDIDA